ncbi:MAG: hypothetical protein LBG07_10625 [Treponema sp.]|nr:hypothetical protein [Treponema sp.]
MRKHLFIINPVSFKARANLDAFISSVKHQFKTAIKGECDVHISLFPRHAVQIIRQYITGAGPEDPVRVYAVGGDGILFDCLNGIVGLPNMELAPVPCGHTNDFVRAFGEGLEGVFRNVLLLAGASTISTDILRCGSNYALNLCTVGLESAAIFHSVTLRKGLRVWPQFFRNSSFIYNLIYSLGGFMAMLDQKILKQK